MIDLITNAIRNQQVLSFTYDSLPRIVEPHALGISRAGNNVLRCYQTQGRHITPGHDWDLCEVAKMKDLQLTGNCFNGPRPGYKRGDKHMAQIFAEL
ncbi:hypothetical protein [Pseudomonas indica]|uniref:hypothetical protein n=1 Tax=Pseudomonas indica TaxID=137658 RepID=UPI000A0005E9|nr:hypothetical protein [Pseudomonas indica]